MQGDTKCLGRLSRLNLRNGSLALIIGCDEVNPLIHSEEHQGLDMFLGYPAGQVLYVNNNLRMKRTILTSLNCARISSKRKKSGTMMKRKNQNRSDVAPWEWRVSTFLPADVGFHALTPLCLWYHM